MVKVQRLFAKTNLKIPSLQYRSQGIKRRHSHLNCTQKVRQKFNAKLFKQPKGLAVCELQAVSPLVLRVGGADKNPTPKGLSKGALFVYSYEKKSIALKVFHQTNSESFKQCGRISLTSKLQSYFFVFMRMRKKSIALKVFHQTNSESFIRQCVAYQLDLFSGQVLFSSAHRKSLKSP